MTRAAGVGVVEVLLVLAVVAALASFTAARVAAADVEVASADATAAD